jgi:pimeloyl-ACP methyl ester carboxylesterase
MTQQTKSIDSGYVSANGVNYYYEITGKGQPLLVLHGGLGSINLFVPNVPALAKHRKVIAVELIGHGRTTLGERPIDPIDIGNDMAVVLKELGYKHVYVVGYSMGGLTGFQFAIQHPDMVSHLALVSTPFAQNGWYPEMLPQQAQMSSASAEFLKDTPVYKTYSAVAPRPEDFPQFLDRVGDFLRRAYDWSEDVKRLTMPVMLVYADGDMVRPEHIVQFYQMLGGWLKDAGPQREHMSRNRLAILPNLTHYDITDSPALVETVLPFLNGQMDMQGSAGAGGQ